MLDTHVHADHISRSRQLAELVGARLYLPEQRRVTYPFAPLREGYVLEIGVSRLAVLSTPGHTEESASYLLEDRALFTGDTLFLRGVGRPDLEASPAQSEARARSLFGSLQRLFSLPGETIVLPGHTAEPVPFDRRPIYAALAEVRRQNQSLLNSLEGFLQAILARIPAAPPNHSRIVALNEAGLLPGPEGTPLAELEAGANRCAVA